MSILINDFSKVLVQGITGREGSFHTQRCIDYGTNVVAGVTPGKGGEVVLDSVPVFNTVSEAVRATSADVALLFVPAPFAADAIIESGEAGISLVICIAEGVPIRDSLNVMRYLEDKPTRLLGPNCPGLISPSAKCKAGIMPGYIHTPGNIGVVSRSGTLTYEAVHQLSELGIGQSTSVGIGGDPVSGTDFVDVLKLFNDDPETEAIVLIGEIGGVKEQEAADFIRHHVTKPVTALIVGQTAPAGKRMGHAGAVITGTAALGSEKVKALKAAGCEIAPGPGEIGVTVQQTLKGNLN